jgi:hypothetical protein
MGRIWAEIIDGTFDFGGPAPSTFQFLVEYLEDGGFGWC